MTRDEMDAAINKEWAKANYGGAPSAHAFIAGIRAAADIVEQSWKDGYRGDVNSGFKYTLLRVANKLSIES